MKLTGKRVLVFGSGISGIGAADLLHRVQAVPVIYDGNENASREDILDRLEQTEQTEIVLGQLPDEVLASVELAVLSPGVPTDIPEVIRIRENKIPVWGEVELAYQMSRGRVLAITGTNGKTTTTALTGKIMEDYFPEVYVVGNIGTPYTSAALKMTEDAVTVAEISSFQLETIQDFAPQVSAVLNITEDHLNRHHTMEEYIRVKELITANQGKNDVCVLNYEDEILRPFGEELKERMQVVFFSSLRELEQGIFLKDGGIVFRRGNDEVMVTKVRDLKLPGRHNHENVMAAAAIALYAGVPIESIRNTIQNFKAVEHRIEYVTEKNGVVYYNDSKGTNPDAAIKGIQAMERPTLLIGGGYDKQSEYTEWIQSFDGKVRYLVLIGQTREKIEREAHACGFTSTILADSLEEAVKICAEKANPGDAVLLSPACASWGQFDNYEQRGDMFKKYVYEL
ncbi:UDP-N-acetylmuramoyl-L-alanine--D-glutamate ligase [Ruminococcus gauvreauii]|uniref:UDP-N-acetylmuramoylalanine--D-glutamate ligase n=1 Tax=Ruminococcus gauvreauii TaxID=438033 RepID=A0ABY5VEZ7_9FIRM|nr:UDP-N-acetylmuramoyl-L-alanine--D-glutamate ligase [Ruminococcus gauvreauii]UWP58506.1 UDP-N-acetylmuramoyl-L-alanine--D-glutamate ligase [Ruminococcus gauvreauii]